MKKAINAQLAQGVLAVDLGSTNGIWVDGVRVDKVLLPANGVLEVGCSRLKVVPQDEPVTLPDEGHERFGAVVTASSSMRRIIAQLRRAARSEAIILLQGETGTGKELVARAIHECSARARGPFVVVDCGAITPTLFESALFGHRKGSFTSAVSDQLGALEAAGGGTVFLDELGELPLEVQPKLLRALDTRTVRRVGEVAERLLDVRFLAATNRDLDACCRDGSFRADLFFRVAVVRAQLPPLRERPEDVPLLANRFALDFSGGSVTLTDGALKVLATYDWPGNVRELRNVIERAVVLAPEKTIAPDELFPQAASGEAGPFHDVKDRVTLEFEKRYVASLLTRHRGNVAGAAREAGLSRSALYALMQRTGHAK